MQPPLWERNWPWARNTLLLRVFYQEIKGKASWLPDFPASRNEQTFGPQPCHVQLLDGIEKDPKNLWKKWAGGKKTIPVNCPSMKVNIDVNMSNTILDNFGFRLSWAEFSSVFLLLLIFCVILWLQERLFFLLLCPLESYQRSEMWLELTKSWNKRTAGSQAGQLINAHHSQFCSRQ